MNVTRLSMEPCGTHMRHSKYTVILTFIPIVLLVAIQHNQKDQARLYSSDCNCQESLQSVLAGSTNLRISDY